MCKDHVNKNLRCVLIALYVPALILCIVHPVVDHGYPLPAVGIIPATLSFASSAFLVLHGRKRRGGQGAIALPLGGHSFFEKAKMNPVLLFLTDAAISVLTLLILILTWAIYPWHDWWARPSLAAYATQPLIALFLIHLWLAGKNLASIVNKIYSLWHKSVPTVCPNCREHYTATPPEQLTQQRGVNVTAGVTEAQPLYRDASFDADAAIRPNEDEIGSHKS